MNYTTDNPIYYFLLINPVKGKEIGHLLLHQNGTIDDFNAITKYKHKALSYLAQHPLTSFKKTLLNHFVYVRSILGKTIYFIAIKKPKHPSSMKALVDKLIAEMEHQGIKRLINSNGELTAIGIKTLAYSMEQFISNYNEKKVRMRSIIKYFNSMMILIKVNRLLKKLIKIIEENKRKGQNRPKLISPISDNDIALAKNEIEQLKKRIKLLYYRFFIIIVGIVVFVIAYRSIDLISPFRSIK